MRPEHVLQINVGKFVRSAVTAPHYFECYDRSQNHSGRQHLHEYNRHVKAGTPDTALVVDGLVYRVELKAHGATASDVTDKQWDRIKEIRDAKGRADWANSVERYGELLEQWGVPLANNWRVQAMHLDGLVQSHAAKAPTTKKPSKPRAAKPTASRVRRVQAIMDRYLPPEPIFTGVKKS